MEAIVPELLDLLRIFKGKLSPDVHQDLYELITQGEHEVALGSLCEILFENEIPVFEAPLEKIKTLATQLKLPANTWSFLLRK